MRPDLRRKELPLLHLVELVALLWRQLHCALVVPQRLERKPRLHVENRMLRVLLSLLGHSLYHLFEVFLRLRLLNTRIVYTVTICINSCRLVYLFCDSLCRFGVNVFNANPVSVCFSRSPLRRS